MFYDALHRAMREEAGTALPRWTVDALSEVAEGRSEVAAVGHPLGFVCLPLERAGQQGVCVHVWSDKLISADPTTSATHAHSWDLTSYVLYGTLRNDLVGVVDAPEEPTHRVFEVCSGAEGDEIRRTPWLVRRRTEVSELHERGEVYSLPAGVFHETVPQGETATLALGRGHPGAVDLTLGSLDTGDHRVRRQRYGGEETAFAASVVAEKLVQVH
ncbi:hypothetical protein SAMN05421805_10540 [Saccharopolyspora antimicrobica]|uniref:Uncharacterized protein n=2 Tax=Saccharopolyspora antimicrobica TaxID=455193 RepID=A0A1I4ZM72_9PSEU|nr:hypothetical protein ATL45_1758 [Saccharopolyspora antimicrobica]SFN51344.1 hypothetical protein SAMN05421805_10540 [Saccharopolyspora antimicrobica]